MEVMVKASAISDASLNALTKAASGTSARPSANESAVACRFLQWSSRTNVKQIGEMLFGFESTIQGSI